MIGIITGDDSTLIECWPVFGSEKGIPKFAQFRIKRSLPYSLWGEYGFSFSSGNSWRDFTVWITWGITTWNWDFDRAIRHIKKKFN